MKKSGKREEKPQITQFQERRLVAVQLENWEEETCTFSNNFIQLTQLTQLFLINIQQEKERGEIGSTILLFPLKFTLFIGRVCAKQTRYTQNGTEVGLSSDINIWQERHEVDGRLVAFIIVNLVFEFGGGSRWHWSNYCQHLSCTFPLMPGERRLSWRN